MGFSLGHACRFSGAFGVSGQNGIGFSGAFASHSNVLKIALTYQSVILHRARCAAVRPGTGHVPVDDNYLLEPIGLPGGTFSFFESGNTE